MTNNLSDGGLFDADGLLSSVVILHEASNHEELIPELPAHLASALGASSVSMVLVGIKADGSEIGRVIHSSGGQREGSEGDWVRELLEQQAAAGFFETAEAVVTRFSPNGGAKLLFVLDADHVVAFAIEAPAAVHTITEQGRAWMLRLLKHVARNLRARINRPGPLVRAVWPLSDLTDAEWRVLMSIDCDDSEREIATALSVSAHTLHSHIKNVYRILRVRSRLSAIGMLHRAERRALIKELMSAEGPQDPILWNHAAGGRVVQAGVAGATAIKKFGRLTPQRFGRERSSGHPFAVSAAVASGPAAGDSNRV